MTTPLTVPVNIQGSIMFSHRLICFRDLLAIVVCLFIQLCATLQAADVDALMTEMTLEEKIGMLHGRQDPEPAIGLGAAGYVAGVPRLDIPPLRLADGPAGIRSDEPATALPAPVALAASFDKALAYEYGQVIGREGRARNQDVLLSPMVNIVRVPQAGRNFETFGEDPLLAAAMVALEVRGIQDAGLMATVKHFIVNNQENNRYDVNVNISERALREIYLPGFLAAVEAGTAAIMCSYNQVNGDHACENDRLLNKLLRDEQGFDGFVMTDWWATHQLDAISNGLNLEMPGYGSFAAGTPPLFPRDLLPAVRAGDISEQTIDEALRPLLVQMNRFGLLDDAERDRPAINREAHAAIALQTALRGAVLLKNEGEALPLEEKGDWLVLGPTARHTLVGGGGSSRVIPFEVDSPLAQLRSLAGEEADFTYQSGLDLDGGPIPAAHFGPGSDNPAGVIRRDEDGAIAATAAQVDFREEGAVPAGSSERWEMILTAPETGRYMLSLQSRGGSGSAFLELDGERVLQSGGGILSPASLIPTADDYSNASLAIDLEAGEAYRLAIDANAADEPMDLRLAWLTPSQRATHIAKAVSAARDSDAVIVFGYIEGTEASDRAALGLPGYQDELIAAVAAANDRTVVVLNVGAPVTMPWGDEVESILQMWYPGQEGGQATARLLLGHDSPGGRLPVTFPRSLTDIPANSAERYPDVDGQQYYDEGLRVGYRWYDAQDITPLFPFGHGLAYGSIHYSNLRVEHAENGVRIRFRVRNEGEHVMDAVPQLYLGPASEVSDFMAPRQLADFDRHTLHPQETREVTLQLDERALSYWSEEAGGWQIAGGERELMVGASSRDIRLRQRFTMPRGTAAPDNSAR